MPHPLKPVSAQVMVITGATSGIGLATARAAAAQGASLILAARDEASLATLCEELRARGAKADFAVADVADPAQVRAIAAKATTVFGGFDTWVNNAGVSIFGAIEDTPIDAQRRLFETNYWGVVNGSLEAIKRLKANRGGGALINVGSVLSDQAIPIQGAYSASKHAVKGFTNALRMELLRESPDVSVTLIKPSAIDTPYSEHARSYLEGPIKTPPPLYAVTLAAEAILHAAEHRVREITVGGGGRLLAVMGQFMAPVAEPLFAWAIPLLSKDRGEDKPQGPDGLDSPGKGLRERIPYFAVRQRSFYTQAQIRPEITAAVLSGGAALALFFLAAKDHLRVRRIRREVRAEYR